MVSFEYFTVFDNKPTVRHKLWLNDTIRNENKIPGEISYQFCDDNYMMTQNILFLNHDTYTDIITFGENVDKVINGSILISIDRVKENSIKFASKFSDELLRVLVHGTLHLCGYKDKSDDDAKLMRMKEDEYINKFNIYQ